MMTKAVLWTNGQITAFDEHGEQMPEYAGIGTETIPKIRRDYPNIEIIGMDWNYDMKGKRV